MSRRVAVPGPPHDAGFPPGVYYFEMIGRQDGISHRRIAMQPAAKPGRKEDRPLDDPHPTD